MIYQRKMSQLCIKIRKGSREVIRDQNDDCQSSQKNWYIYKSLQIIVSKILRMGCWEQKVANATAHHLDPIHVIDCAAVVVT